MIANTLRLLALTLSVFPLSTSSGSDLDDCLSKLGDSERPVSSQTVRSCTEIISSHGIAGDDELWSALRRIITDDELPAVVRLGVFGVACEKADEAIALEIVGLCIDWASFVGSVDSVGQLAMRNQEFLAESMMVSTFVLQHLQDVEKLSSDQRSILELLKIVATQNTYSLKAKQRSYAAVAGSPAPVEQRRACALAILDNQRHRADVPAPLLTLFDKSSLATLRQRVRASETFEAFHFAAAATLAHIGDVEVLDILESRSVEFRPKHPEHSDLLQGFVWQIRTQQELAKLLEFISSGENLLVVEPRFWAIRRALELHTPKEVIREAILKWAHRINSSDAGDPYGSMIVLKTRALELGILHESDLPAVDTAQSGRKKRKKRG